MQINNRATVSQAMPIFFTQHCTAARCQYNIIHRSQFLNHHTFPLPESLLPFYLKNSGDIHAGTLADNVIAIIKRILQMISKLAAKRCFTCSHQAD